MALGLAQHRLEHDHISTKRFFCLYSVAMSDFDFIIVGAGSAGCVLANHLSQKHRVLLLEAGHNDNNPWLHIPIGYGKTFHDPITNWQYTSVETPAINGRKMYIPRGKTLGGSSAINAMVYARGHPQDYDNWNRLAKGWAWQDVEPIFQRMENWQGTPHPKRGGGGPVDVEDIAQNAHPLTRAYLRAAEQSGIPINPDYNAESMLGASLYQTTTKRGWRVSAARAYLRSNINKHNLSVETCAFVQRIIINNKTATAVEYRQHGKIIRKTAGEIILCAGAINSPQLLELSGIGDGKTLRKFNIPVHQDCSLVGEHLQDHLGASLIFRTRVPTLNQKLNPWYGKLWAGLQFLLTRKGPLSLSLNQGGGFVRRDNKEGVPEIQLYFSPISYLCAPTNTRPMMNTDPFPGILIGFNPCKPTSKGSIHLQSPEPETPPSICPNYLDTEHDRQLMRDGIKLLRELASAPALAEVVDEEICPGVDHHSDEDFDEYVRQHCWTVFHQCGTCRMGDDANSSVVDGQLRVHGINRLRVADASIFPEIPTANTNAPAMMVGEAASRHILADC